MHRIDGPGATPGHLFTEGDPVGGVEATTVTDDWLNDVQEELINVLAAAGIAPVKGTQNQVLLSIQSLIASGVTAATATKVVTITASGTYTRPAGLKAAFIQVQAAGGGGGGSQGNATGGAAGAGGSAGGYSEGYFTAAAIGASQAVTVGAAGPGGTGPSGSGSAGGASSFGALLTASGGSFGASGATSGSTARGPAPSVSGGGTGSTQTGQNGGIGIVFGALNAAIAGDGGSSRLGIGGRGRNEGSNGFNGSGYGSGGAGGASSTITQNGGPGAPGVVIVWEFY